MIHLLKWEKNPEFKIKYAILAAIATATPLLIGFMIDKPSLGVFATLGSMALVRHGDIGGSVAFIVLCLIEMIFAALGFSFGMVMPLEMILSVLLVPFVFFIVGALGSFSQSFARSSAVFIIFSAIGMNFSTSHIPLHVATYFFVLGALWMIVLTFIYRIISWQIQGCPKLIEKKEFSLKQLWKRWCKEISSFQGLRYALRIGLSSFVCMIIIYFFPFPHSAWIVLTVGIVVQRNIHLVLQRILQRGLGTIVGVALLGLASLFVIKPSIHIMLIVILALIQSLIKHGNYFLYSAVITAFVVIMIDIGSTVTIQTMFERLFATLIGCAIAIIFGYLPWVKNHK